MMSHFKCPKRTTPPPQCLVGENPTWFVPHARVYGDIIHTTMCTAEPPPYALLFIFFLVGVAMYTVTIIHRYRAAYDTFGFS